MKDKLEKVQQEYAELQIQFNKYKEQNDVNHYFYKQLNDDTRKETLQLLEHFLQKEDDLLESIVRG